MPSDLTDEANIAIAAPNTIIDVAVLIKPLPEPSISFAAADIVTIKPAILTKPLTISPQLRLDKDFIDADSNNIAIDIPTMAVANPVIFPKPLVSSIFSKSTIAPINSANNAVIPVKNLAGIKIENLTREVLDQYTIIDKALDRIQRVLGINDSFLGMAYASDSGTKLKLQQNASVVALRYVTSKVESFYRLLGWDIMNLIKQYYTAHDVLRIADTYEGQKWLEINQPLMIPTGNINPQTGQPEMRPVYEEVLDPETQEPIVSEDGSIVMAPIPTRGTEIAFTKADIEVDTVAYNDEDERNQVMIEQFLNGPIGNMLSQINPVGYFKASELSIKNIKSKYSMEIGAILNETAQMLGGNPQMQQQMQQGQVAGQQSTQQAINQQGGRPSQGGM